MKTKKDIEKITDNISPHISPGVPILAARSQKILSISAEQESDPILDISVDKKS